MSVIQQFQHSNEIYTIVWIILKHGVLVLFCVEGDYLYV